jgi:tetratricopeptide (TPR) repeat protein
VLALPARFPSRADASIAAARVLASERRHAEALAALGDSSAWLTLPLDARVLAARSLRALDRASEALPLVDGLPLAGDAAILRAELVAAVKGPAEGAAAFRALTNDSRATADVFLAWASTSRTAPERLAILDDANHRFPGRADVLRSLARNRWLIGEMDEARAAASAAIAVAPRDDDAWFVLVDATAAARPRAELDEVLRRFDARIADSPALVIGMAERLAGLARTPDDPLLSQAFHWLDTVAVDEALIVPQELARVRLLASAERWDAALDAVGAILQRQPAPLQALRLRAEVLSWAGRHVDALAAYDTYLRAAPNDIEARRQQARVAGWAGRYGQSRRLYGTLQSVVTDDATVSAEIAAKGAFFAGRWQDASRAYERWLALEPDNTEARFELAETLRAQGHARAADQMLLQLGSASGHRLAMAAYDRAVFNRRPSFALIDRRRDASGYGGLRLLDLREHGGSVAVGFDAGDRTGLIVEGAALQAVAGPDRRSGSRALLAGTTRVSERWTLAARGEWWQLGGSDGSIAGVIQAAWRPADHWTLTAGTDRERIFDTLATVDRRLTASGVFAASERQSPQSSLQVRFGWQHLSDDNARHRTSVTATRTLGLRQVRAIVWIEGLGYRRTTTDYFSPSGFVRADAGVEYTHQFAKPRFQGDRRREIAGTYLIGTDDRGVRYQHPSLRLAFEAVRGLTVDMTAGAIRSSVYKDASFSISLRVGGAAPRR